ncbi:MAG: hypothetical protein QOG78_1588 [Rhodospirillaceae bacterium]|nr:hypothetical protein [Rhodospirillaceae bacterium]
MMLTANRASRSGAPCERGVAGVPRLQPASARAAALVTPPGRAVQDSRPVGRPVAPQDDAARVGGNRLAQRCDRGLLDHDPCRDKIMVGRGVRWHRRRNRARLGGVIAFRPPAFDPLSRLFGARRMTAAPLVIVAAQRVLDRAEQPAHRGEGRRLAAGRATDQGLPQHQRLRPGRRDLRRHTGPAHAGDGGEEGLGHIVCRRARQPRRIGDPVAPRPGQPREWEFRHGAASLFEEARVDGAPVEVFHAVARRRPARRAEGGRVIGRICEAGHRADPL